MRIAIFYAKAGGGHISTAKSLAQELLLQPDITVDLVDGFSGSSSQINIFFEHSYSRLTNGPHIFWNTFYTLTKSPYILKPLFKLMSFVTYKTIASYIVEQKPDKIVTTYYFAKIIRNILKKYNLTIPLFVIITDLSTFHPVWTQETDCNYLVYTEQAKQRAINYGINQKNITVFSPIINAKFNQKLSKQEIISLKKNYLISDKKPFLLIAGGGEGLKNADIILQKLLQSNLEINIALVCGNNQKLKAKCEQTLNQFNSNLDQVTIYGFTEAMYDLMNMADLIITKGGPATIMEAISLYKPLILTNYIWEQEKGNVEFVQNNKLGFYTPNLDQVVEKVSIILHNESIKNEIILHQQSLEFKNGVQAIAKHIIAHNN